MRWCSEEEGDPFFCRDFELLFAALLAVVSELVIFLAKDLFISVHVVIMQPVVGEGDNEIPKERDCPLG
ncbi:hypothetical protein CTT39_05975 [Agrobacterium rosae]|nr:hypothetical protein CTT39_05975 [Agrobacterium rosae]